MAAPQYGAQPPPPPQQYGAPPPAAPGLQADYGKRIIAFIIDAVIVGVAGNIISVIGGLIGGYGYGFYSFNGLGLAFTALVTAASILYWPFMLAQQGGQTIGQKILGLRVVRRDGGPMDWGTAFKHTLLIWLGYLTCGITMIVELIVSIMDSTDHLTISQKMAGTLVVPAAGAAVQMPDLMPQQQQPGYAAPPPQGYAAPPPQAPPPGMPPQAPPPPQAMPPQAPPPPQAMPPQAPPPQAPPPPQAMPPQAPPPPAMPPQAPPPQAPPQAPPPPPPPG